MKLFLFFLYMFLVVFNQDANSADPHTPEEVFAYASELEARGDFQRAATEFGRYVSSSSRASEQTFPRLEEAMFRLAVNLAQSREVDGALRAFSDLGARYPKSEYIPLALLRMGYIYEKNGAVEEATRRYRRLLEHGMDTEFSALSRLRLAWLALGKPGEEEVARHHLRSVTHPRFVNQAKGMLQGVDDLSNLPYKDPWISGAMTAVLPGAGHLYLKRPEDAGLAFLSNGLLLAGTLQAFSQGITGLGAALGLMELGWYSGTVFSAVSLTNKHNKQIRDESLNRMGFLIKPEANALGLEMEWQY
ncbi:MAG: tetratricopeptide repeat protein [Magnetococcales bacterium]|nr:tetratricopeptide repeat protein [Magnetococcales bacterium]